MRFLHAPPTTLPSPAQRSPSHSARGPSPSRPPAPPAGSGSTAVSCGRSRPSWRARRRRASFACEREKGRGVSGASGGTRVSLELSWWRSVPEGVDVAFEFELAVGGDADEAVGDENCVGREDGQLRRSRRRQGQRGRVACAGQPVVRSVRSTCGTHTPQTRSQDNTEQRTKYLYSNEPITSPFPVPLSSKSSAAALGTRAASAAVYRPRPASRYRKNVALLTWLLASCITNAKVDRRRQAGSDWRAAADTRGAGEEADKASARRP